MEIPACENSKQYDQLSQMRQALQMVLDTFGRTDGVMITVQTKQHVLQNIRELLEIADHGR